MEESPLHNPPTLRLKRSGLLAVTLLALVILGTLGAEAVHRRNTSPTLSLEAPRLVVLKGLRLMHLFDGDQLIRTYPIDLGFDPIGPKRREGDGRTPEGSFQIITKNPDSRFHRFLGIDYPNEDAVAYGLQHGMISLGEAASIRHANASVRRPDWTTALGGGLGIHGFARGADWTAGCIALADDSVTELFDVLRIGDPVEILP